MKKCFLLYIFCSSQLFADLISPPNGSTISYIQVKFEWEAIDNSTKYEFIYNGPAYNENGEIIENQDNNLETNTDIIEFTYDPEEEYINRACSFKVNYLNIDYIIEGGEDGRWISRMRFLTNNITTDNFENDDEEDEDNDDNEDVPTAHLNIFFD